MYFYICAVALLAGGVPGVDAAGAILPDDSDMLQMGMNDSVLLPPSASTLAQHRHEKHSMLYRESGGRIRLRRDVQALQCASTPCKYKVDCADRLFEMLNTTDALLRKNHIPYFIMAGTLLGALRHESIIPYTADVDIVMHRDDMAKLLKVSHHSAVNFEKDHEHGVFRGCERKTSASSRPFSMDDVSLPYVDIYPIETWEEFKPFRELMTGSNKAKIRGHTFPVPKDPNYILCSMYGQNWKKPTGSAKSATSSLAHGVESVDSMSKCNRCASC